MVDMCSHSALGIAFGPLMIIIISGWGILGTLWLLCTGLPASSWSLPLLRWLRGPRRRSSTSESSTNPDGCLCLTESPRNVPEQIVYKTREMGGKGKPIFLVSFISFKSYCNTLLESNNLRYKKISCQFSSLKKKTTTAPSVEFKEKIQISGSVRAIEMEAARNSSIATVKDPSANFHASLPSLLSRHVVMVGVGDFVVGL